MPQSTPERRKRWKTDHNATNYLISRGFKLTKDWQWIKPREKLTEKEEDAIQYMFEEWDYGGCISETTRDWIKAEEYRDRKIDRETK